MLTSFFRQYLSASLGIIVTLLLGACHKLNIVEQLDSPDKRVPIITADDQTYKSVGIDNSNIYVHQGNYYCLIPVAYATESYDIISETRLDPWDCKTKPEWRTFSNIGPWQLYYFPLSDAEVDYYLNRPKGTTKQAQSGHIVSLTEAPKMKKVTPSDHTDFYICKHPESIKIVGQDNDYEAIDSLPIHPGKRTLTQSVLLPAAYLADISGNTALWATESCACIAGFITLYPLLFILEPIYVRYFYAG